MLSVVAACSGSEVSEDEPVAEGDGLDENDLRSSDVVYETQLRGNDMAAKQIHLTFDDGPGTRTSELTRYLEQEGISATFFINGINVEGREQAVRDIVARGHLLANHSQHHLLLSRESSATFAAEVNATDALVRQYQPGKPVFFRAPYAGINSPMVRQLVQFDSPQIGPIHWEIGTKITDSSAADWECWSKKVSVERCAQLYQKEIETKGHGVVLVHDIHSKTVDMVKLLVPRLKAKGFKFVRLTASPRIAKAQQGMPKFSSSKCLSGTLFEVVGEGTCVQSSHQGAWRVCAGGEWSARTANTSCTSERPL